MNIKLLFHYISYLQYPFVILAFYFAISPYLNGFEINDETVSVIIKSINNMMIYIGLAISFASLQDTSKTSLDFEKKVWENAETGKKFILIIAVMMLLTLAFGLFGYFVSNNETVKELSFGAIVLGIGLIGFLKTAVEVFENHTKDKK